MERRSGSGSHSDGDGTAMSRSQQANDRISTGPAIPAAILRLCLPVAAVLAALLIPVLVWQLVVIAMAVLGMVFPHSFAGWLSIGALAIGFLLAEPAIWQITAAVLLVHIIHVMSSLVAVVPWRGIVVLSALRPTLRRLLLVQLVAQPVTLAVVLVQRSSVEVGVAALVGAAAFATFAVVILIRVDRRSKQVRAGSPR